MLPGSNRMKYKYINIWTVFAKFGRRFHPCDCADHYLSILMTFANKCKVRGVYIEGFEDTVNPFLGLR